MRALASLFFFCAGAHAQFTVTVGNAASGASGLVPNSLARVFLTPPPLPVASANVQIAPASGPPVPATVLSASQSQIVFLVPAALPLGAATVTVTVNGQTGVPAPLEIVSSNIGIFTTSSNSFGPALAPPYRLTDPALPGQYVTLWTTGLGAARPVTVTLGGHPVPVTYAGPAPGFSGLDQINFQIPTDPAIPDGCYVALSIHSPASDSSTASLPKSTTAGPCRSPFGLSPTTLAQLDAGQRINLPLFSIASTIAPTPGLSSYLRNESAAANFFQLDAPTITIFSQPLLAEDVYYSCSISTPGGATGGLIFGSSVIDLGPKFTLHGPQNSLDVPGSLAIYQAMIPATGPVASPTALPAPFFIAGPWQLTDDGSASVLPFQFGLTLPPPIQLTNAPQLSTLGRDADQLLQWDSTGYSPSLTATATLAFAGNPFFTAASITCRVPASAGRLTFPAALLQALPANNPAYDLRISISHRPDSVPQFSIPLKHGTQLPAILQYLSSETIPVTIQ